MMKITSVLNTTTLALKHYPPGIHGKKIFEKITGILDFEGIAITVFVFQILHK
jgi:hypothetical protein